MPCPHHEPVNQVQEDLNQAMRTQKTIRLFTLALPAAFVVASFCVPAVGQTPAPLPEQKTTPNTATHTSKVIVENKPAAPQVVTILHSLNGLKGFRLLLCFN